MELHGVTVCVGYDDLLALTLPRNLQHFSRLCVITAPHDTKTRDLVGELAVRHVNLRLYETDIFYARGASFNKGAALEEVLANYWLGDTWSVIFDADILMPPGLPGLVEAATRKVWKPKDKLFSPRRYQVETRQELDLVVSGSPVPLNAIPDAEQAGFFQLFHPSSPHLKSRPWYGTQWLHAGGCDSDFMKKFPEEDRRWLPFHVYHLNSHGINWHGRVTPRWDGANITGGPISPEEASRRHKEMIRHRREFKGRDDHATEKLNGA